MASAMLNFFDQDYFRVECQCGQSEENECAIHNTNKLPLTPNSGRTSPNWPTPKIDGYKRKSGEEKNPSKACEIEINQSFPRQPNDEFLVGMIEYRVKLLSSENVVIEPGENKMVKTSVLIARKPGKLSLLMKPPDNLSLRFLSEGYISQTYRGNLSVSLQNPHNEKVLIPPGTVVGFLIMAPFELS